MSTQPDEQALDVVNWAVQLAAETEEDEIWSTSADPVQALLLARMIVAAEAPAATEG